MTRARFKLPPLGALTPNSAVDPFRFYYRPLVGRIFSARIDAGLRLLDGTRFKRLLEIGYGSGLLMPTLAPLTDELYGVDLAAEPPGLRGALAALGAEPRELVKADVQKLPFPDEKFDGVVAFSIFEHLDRAALERAIGEVARVLQPGGRLLVGCPAVHRAMNAAFFAIGFRDIERHHLSSIGDVLDAARPRFTVEKRAALPRLLSRAPAGLAPYTAVLLRKIDERAVPA